MTGRTDEPMAENWTVTAPKRVPLFPLLWYSHVVRGSVIQRPPLYGLTPMQALRRARRWLIKYKFILAAADGTP